MKAKKYTREDMETASALSGLAHVITVDDGNRAEIEANTALLASERRWRAFCDEFEKSYRNLAQAQDRKRAVAAFVGKCFTAGRHAETLAAILERGSSVPPRDAAERNPAMTPACEVYVDLRREPNIDGKLVTSVNCSYPGCTEATLNGIVVAFMDMGAVKCRAFCSELHALFILAELAARDLGCLGDGEDLVTDMVRRHLAGEVLDGSSQEEIDSDVDGILGGDSSEPAA